MIRCDCCLCIVYCRCYTSVKRCEPLIERSLYKCLFIRSSQNHLARHRERGKKTRQTEEEVVRQHQGMDRPGVQ